VSRRNRDISEYAHSRGATSLLDFLDAERSYRATQLSFRQAIAANMQSIEQLRQAMGVRSAVTRAKVRTRIQETAILPAVRLHSAEEALFAAESVCAAGIPRSKSP
jgi:outer membrane protein TolC